MTKLRLMSTNQWACDKNMPEWEKLGFDCSPEARMPGFLKYYIEKKPDVLGLQEVTARMADKLMQLFSENNMPYALLWGRDTPIIYRTDIFELVDSTFLIYPDNIPEYEGIFNNSKTKSYNIGVFRIKETGALFLLATTHLWYKSSNPKSDSYQPFSDEARAYQINLAIDAIDKLQAKYNCPAVIMGDLNAVRTSLALEAAFSRGFEHCYDLAIEHRDEGHGTHYCFGDGFKPYNPREAKYAIDHILVRGVEKDAVRTFDRYAPDYYMCLSDHIPVWIDINI